jgi:hypothetical protein
MNSLSWGQRQSGGSVRKSRGISTAAQTRDRLVKQRIALESRVSNILSACGLNLTEEIFTNEKNLAEVLERIRNEVVRMQLRVLVSQVRALNSDIAELESARALFTSQV